MRVNTNKLQRGYMLLEACLALIITAIILTAVFKITDWNLKVSQSSINSSNEHIKEAAFFSFLDRAFMEMNGDAIVNLTFNETPQHFLSELIIQNSSQPFTWPKLPFTVKAVKIVTRPNSDNNLDIVIEYYSEYLLSSPFERNAVTVLPNQEPIQTLTILENILRFEWRVWDGLGSDQEGNPNWVGLWENNSNTPRYFELNTIFDQERTPILHTFWSPKKVNPTTHFQVQQNRQNQPTNTIEEQPTNTVEEQPTVTEETGQ